MTGQDLLNQMQVFDNELLLQSGEADVSRGLVALAMAQRLFESLLAMRPKILGNARGTLAVADATETTAFPADVLRLDALWMLDATTGRPLYRLNKLDENGGHASSGNWPVYLNFPLYGGRVRAYWEDGTDIYWSPFPQQADTIRWYGFRAAAAPTATGTFAYPDIVALPLAAFATKLMKIGVGDESLDLNAATGTFGQVLDALSRHNRDGASGFIYTRYHVT